jgi:hypothetical protein
MTTRKPDSETVLRVINDTGAEAGHSTDEARDALVAAGVDPEQLAGGVLDRLRPTMASSRGRVMPWEAIRSSALALAAIAAAFFAVASYLQSRADIAARREATRASLISPLLPGLASDDPERRSVALAVAEQVDPAFAAATAARLVRWEATTQAQARASRNTAYATRIVAGMQKLALSRDPNDRKVAIWNDLLPVLIEARKNRDDFVDVAMSYQQVLPLLRVRNPDVFLDSYWGELWILNILLESRIDPVVEAARQQAPEPAVVEQIYQRYSGTLADRDRKAFEEAVSVYGHTFKALRSPQE